MRYAKKISELTEIMAVTNNDYFIIVDAETGENRKVKKSTLFAGFIPDTSNGLVIGGVANNFTVNAQGEVVMNGTATIYDDLQHILIGERLESPSSDIVQNNAEGTLTFKTSARNNDYVAMNIQLTHKWKIGSVVYPHLHFWQSTANVPNWILQYRWQAQGEAKVTAWTNLKIDSNAFAYTSGILNQISAFESITPPVDAGLSDILQVRLIRDYTNVLGEYAGTDPVNASVEAVSFDIHVECDTLGSNEEYIK